MAFAMALGWATFPALNLDRLKRDYHSGKLTMRELMDKVDLGPDATYEDYCEVFDSLIE